MEAARLTRRQDSTRRGKEPSNSSSNSQQKEARRIKDEKGETTESAILTRTQESNENESSSSVVEQKKVKSIEIDARYDVNSVAFLADGDIVSGGSEGKIRHWQVKDGKEVGTPMNAGSAVRNMAVSPDGKWIVSGSSSGQVTVWNAKTHELVNGFKGHDEGVYVVDLSPDATKIATGSYDKTVCIWSLSTRQRLLGPFEHPNWVIAVKFSPDGRLIATVTFRRKSVRIYDSQDGRLLVNFPIQVSSSLSNQSLAWVRDSKQLFVLSRDGNIHRLDVSSRTTLFNLGPTHGYNFAKCISLASNGTFIAASADSSVSFWDTATHQ